MDIKRLAKRLVLALTIPGIVGILVLCIDADHPLCTAFPQWCKIMGTGGRPLHIAFTLLVLFVWWIVSTHDSRLAIAEWILIEKLALVFMLVWVFAVSVILGGTVMLLWSFRWLFL